MSAFKPTKPSQTGAGALINETTTIPATNYPKTKKKKWEDNYKRATFYVQNDTMDEIERYAGNEKGEKTRIINEALQDWLKKQEQ